MIKYKNDISYEGQSKSFRSHNSKKLVNVVQHNKRENNCNFKDVVHGKPLLWCRLE